MVVRHILPQAFLECSVLVEQGIHLEEAVNIAANGSRAGINGDAGGRQCAGLGSEDSFGKFGKACHGSAVASSDVVEAHALAASGEFFGKDFVTGPVQGIGISALEPLLAELVDLGFDLALAGNELLAGEFQLRFGQQEIGCILFGPGFDALRGVALLHHHAGRGCLISVEGSAGKQSMAEFVRQHVAALGIHIQKYPSPLALGGLDIHAGRSCASESIDVERVVFGPERDDVHLLPEEALHGCHADQLVGIHGFGHAGDIATGQLDIDKHAGYVGDCGLLPTLTESDASRRHTAQATKSRTHAKHDGGFVLFSNCCGKGRKGSAKHRAFDCACSSSGDSAHALHDERICQAVHDGSGLRTERFIHCESGGSAFDGKELPWIC